MRSAVFAPTGPSHLATAAAASSGPSSEGMGIGTPRHQQVGPHVDDLGHAEVAAVVRAVQGDVMGPT